MKLNKQNKKGFTIVELVIVIAVIGILSAILIPTFANLTNDAQKAARKQQAADAYTAYLLEATDNQYDGLYKLVDAKHVEADVKIAQKSQANVTLNLKGTNFWFTYDAEKGWQEAEAEPTGKGDLVCKPFTVAADADTALYTKNGNDYSAFIAVNTAAADANAKLSTFNGAVVYTYTAA